MNVTSTKRSIARDSVVTPIARFMRRKVRCTIINLSVSRVKKGEPWLKAISEVKKLPVSEQKEMMDALFTAMKCVKLPAMKPWLDMWDEAAMLPPPEQKEKVEKLVLAMKDIKFSTKNILLLFNKGLRELGREAMWLSAHLMASYLARRQNVQASKILIKMMGILAPNGELDLKEDDNRVREILTSIKK